MLPALPGAFLCAPGMSISAWVNLNKLVEELLKLYPQIT
jgi:hypothetical protein